MFSPKFNSVRSLSISVSEKVGRGELNIALHTIHAFVEKIITEPVCTAQSFGSRVLDDTCQKIGKANWAAHEFAIDVSKPRHGAIIYVYIVTKLQKSGGHSRMVEDFINAFPGKRHIVLCTELAGRSDRDYVFATLEKNCNVQVNYAPSGSFQEKLTWLQKQLINISPTKTYLFNHHSDSVAIAAIQPEMELDAWFYHHGDHNLCLGIYLPHLKHIDPHPMGYHNCRDSLEIENYFIPLVVEDKGYRQNIAPFINDGILTTCTAARSNKIEPLYFISYLDVIPKLLHVTGGRHVHIGRLTPWALFKIRRGLKKAGVSTQNFIYIPWVQSVWNALQEFRVDLYIASFPYGGGLTLIEAMGAGIPVALHKHIASRLLSGFDLAYSEAFCWQYPEELIDYCSRLNPENLEEQSILGRKQYENFHRREIFEAAVANPDKMVAPPNLPTSFIPQTDEWSCWMANQLSFGQLTKRGIYRLFKKIRTNFAPCVFHQLMHTLLISWIRHNR